MEERLSRLSRELVAHTYNLSYSEAEIRRITVQRQTRQIVCKALSPKNPSHTHTHTHTHTKAGRGVGQSIGSEFNLQYHKKKKRKNIRA
jgi:hypothetical protein